jgi:hypothetical protein
MSPIGPLLPSRRFRIDGRYWNKIRHGPFAKPIIPVANDPKPTSRRAVSLLGSYSATTDLVNSHRVVIAGHRQGRPEISTP